MEILKRLKLRGMYSFLLSPFYYLQKYGCPTSNLLVLQHQVFYIASVTTFSSTLSINRGSGWGGRLQNVTVIVQHFAGFSFILLFFVQIQKSLRASWILPVVGLAFCFQSMWDHLRISCIEPTNLLHPSAVIIIKKSIGPSFVPCGTPAWMVFHIWCFPQYLTHCALFF